MILTPTNREFLSKILKLFLYLVCFFVFIFTLAYIFENSTSLNPEKSDIYARCMSVDGYYSHPTNSCYVDGEELK